MGENFSLKYSTTDNKKEKNKTKLLEFFCRLSNARFNNITKSKHDDIFNRNVKVTQNATQIKSSTI